MLILMCKNCGKVGSLEDFDGYEDYCPDCGSRDVIPKETDFNA